jgi:histone acetyltransferase (RNA polymerase elongator complex component)
MNEELLKSLSAQIVREMIEQRHTLWIDPQEHSAQHEFLQTLIAERAEKLARRKAIQDKIAGSLILSLIVGVVGMLGAGVLDWVRNHLK